jgi:hypothetical protein
MKKSRLLVSMATAAMLTLSGPTKAGGCNSSEMDTCSIVCMAATSTCFVGGKYTCWDSGPGRIQCGVKRLVLCICFWDGVDIIPVKG